MNEAESMRAERYQQSLQYLLQGNEFLQQARWNEASHAYRKAIDLFPEFADAFNNLAIALQRQGKWEDAMLHYRRALDLEPNNPNTWYNLGQGYFERNEFEAAIAAIQQSLALFPQRANGYLFVGVAYSFLGEHGKAIQALNQAIALDPLPATYHFQLAMAEQRQGNIEPAMEAYRRTIQLHPGFAEAHFNLGCLYQETGDYEQAVEHCRRGIELKPGIGEVTLAHQLQHLCRWEEAEKWGAIALGQLDQAAPIPPHVSIHPFAFLALSIPTTAEQQWQAACRWADQKRFHAAKTTPRRSAVDRLRVGYLSTDFRQHAVGHLIAELFACHDRHRFEIHAYSLMRRDDDPIQRSIAGHVDRWRDLHACSHRQAADCIAHDQIDILIDLNGYTRNARTEILAQRPSPIQALYLGYPGTMGATSIDYLIADEWVIPADQRSFYREQIIDLPGCFMVQESLAAKPLPKTQRQDWGLPEESLILCGWSGAYKITSRVFACWLHCLRQLPQAVLWLREPHSLARAAMLEAARQAGVAPERLVFAPRVDRELHLARQTLADLFLDTFPYNQHSTAADALRCGVPVVTCSGQTFASRVAGSLLRELGMSEGITVDLQAYQAKILEWAESPERLQSLRARLSEGVKASDLFHPHRFVTKLEGAYEAMWQMKQKETA